MTQDELNRLYKECYNKYEDEEDEDAGWEKGRKEYQQKLGELGVDEVCFEKGWEGVERLIRYMEKQGFVILNDPDMDGSSMSSLVIFPPKRAT